MHFRGVLDTTLNLPDDAEPGDAWLIKVDGTVGNAMVRSGDTLVWEETTGWLVIAAIPRDEVENRITDQMKLQMDQRMNQAIIHGPQVQTYRPDWTLTGEIERPDEPHTFEELNADLDVRLDALRRGRTGWGCDGMHRGSGAPDCPRHLHHHHDAFCREPSDMELRLAGVEKPETGWDSRA